MIDSLLEDLLIALAIWGARKLYAWLRTELEVRYEMATLEHEDAWRP